MLLEKIKQTCKKKQDNLTLLCLRLNVLSIIHITVIYDVMDYNFLYRSCTGYEMDPAFGAYGGRERCAQGFGGEA
jgi:hypothetical protein